MGEIHLILLKARPGRVRQGLAAGLYVSGLAMKTILVTAGGSASDDVTFEAAYAAAQCFDVHLEFFHIRIAPTEAALYPPHVASARGRAMVSRACDLKPMTATLRPNATFLISAA
jgi:hypothetical protein